MSTEISDKARIIELERGRPIREILAEMAAQGLDYEAMGDELGVSGMTVRRWAKGMGAERRIHIPAGVS
jgi:hypothetical protein